MSNSAVIVSLFRLRASKLPVVLLFIASALFSACGPKAPASPEDWLERARLAGEKAASFRAITTVHVQGEPYIRMESILQRDGARREYFGTTQFPVFGEESLLLYSGERGTWAKLPGSAEWKASDDDPAVEALRVQMDNVLRSVNAAEALEAIREAVTAYSLGEPDTTGEKPVQVVRVTADPAKLVSLISLPEGAPSDVILDAQYSFYIGREDYLVYRYVGKLTFKDPDSDSNVEVTTETVIDGYDQVKVELPAELMEAIGQD